MPLTLALQSAPLPRRTAWSSAAQGLAQERHGARRRRNVELGNAFIGKSERPSPDEVSKALGPTAILWNEFVKWMASKLGVADQEWKGIYVHKHGWSLTLKRKK